MIRKVTVLLLALLSAGCTSGELRIPTEQQSADATRRRAIVIKAARRGDPKCVHAMSMLLDKDVERVPLVRATAAVGLRMIGDERAVPALLKASADPSPLVRADVMRALGDLAGPDAIGAPANAARTDTDAGVRMEAVRALARIGGEEAIPHLLDALADVDGSVAFAAHRALIQRTGMDLPPSRQAWKLRLDGQKPAGSRK